MTTKSILLAELDFASATPCVPNPKVGRFVLPIPATDDDDADELVYPDGWTVTYEKDGEKVTEDVSGKRLRAWPFSPDKELSYGYGFTIWNGTDGAIQAARTDGNAILILNGITEETANALYAKVAEYTEDPTDLTFQEVKSIREFALTQLGLADAYDSDRNYDESAFLPARPGDDRQLDNDGDLIPAFGWKVRKQDLCYSLFVSGPCEFLDGPAATPQQYPNGGVALSSFVKKQEHRRGIEPGAFLFTYVKPDGSPFLASA